MNIFQGLSALMCALTISKEFGEHHFHELSGKTDIPSIGLFNFSLDLLIQYLYISSNNLH